MQPNQLSIPKVDSKADLASVHRVEVIEYFVTLGKEVFSRDHLPQKHSFKQYSILNWLYFESQEKAIPLSRYEVNEIVDVVLAAANQVLLAGAGRLTVGELKKSLEGLPDNTPVLYQRIEDFYFDQHQWKTVNFVWDSYVAKPRDIQWVQDNPSEEYDIIEKDGELLYRSLSKYIPAFSAISTVTDNGEKAFIINAHY